MWGANKSSSSSSGGRGRGRGRGRGGSAYSRGRGGASLASVVRHPRSGAEQSGSSMTMDSTFLKESSHMTQTKLNRVHLDGLVVMKIIKHCAESLPTFVAGSLLGLDVEDRLDISHCFPFPNVSSGDDGSEYQMDMLKALRDVNVDNNQVGWYQSTYLGSYCSKDLILTQYEFQSNLGPNSVVVIYDPVRSASGTLSMKALRLTDAFMAAYQDNKITAEAAAKVPLASGTVFEEVPLRVHNSELVQALLVDLEAKEKGKQAAAVMSLDKQATAQDFRSQTNVVDSEIDRLDLSATAFLEKNLQFLSDQVDDLAYKQYVHTAIERRHAHHKKQREEWIEARKQQNVARASEGLEPLPLEDSSLPFFRSLEEDSVDKLESILMSAQVSTYCDQVNKLAGQSFGKLFLAGGFQQGSLE